MNVLFSGGAAAVVPAAAAGGNEFVLSDWTAVAPLDRTDVVGAYYLSYIRSYIALAGSPYGSPSGNSVGYAGNVAGGLIRNSGFQVADKIASPAGFTSAGGVTGYHLPIIVNARTLARVTRVLSIGDSLTGGQVASDGGEYWSVVERAVSSINTTLGAVAGPSMDYFSHVNLGFGGQTFIQYHARLAKALASLVADVVVMPVWSPNSAITTQAAFDQSMAVLLDSIDRVNAAGARPVLWTASPKNTITAADDAWRLKANTVARNLASSGYVTVADVASITDTGATPGQWVAGYSGDGLHPNGSGSDAIAVLLKQAILDAAP